jgi:hypothetical protein
MSIQNQDETGRILWLAPQPTNQAVSTVLFQRGARIDQRVAELDIFERRLRALGVPEPAERGGTDGYADDEPERQENSQQKASHKPATYSAGINT